MEEKVLTQEDLDRIIKKNSAKYLKKLEEKDAEINQYKEALEGMAVENQPAKNLPQNDEEVIRVVEEILNIPPKQRSVEQDEILASLDVAYGNALFNRDLNEAKEWAKENYDGDVDELLKNEDFVEFTKDINGNVADLIKKYISLTAKQVEEVKNQAKTPGSAKDTSGVVAKEYFSKEEVERMTPAQIKKYMPIIEKSMINW